MSRLCVIPARGGSKRIPRKNIKDFCGKPMIAHVIEAAQQSGVFDTIHVSTDDQEIANVASQFGAAPDFVREGLADDHAGIVEVVRYVVDEYEQRDKSFDTVALLYATAPFLDGEELKKVCEQFDSGDKSTGLMSVSPFPVPVEQSYRLQDDGLLVPDNPEQFLKRTQDLGQAYYEAAMFIFYDIDFLKSTHGVGDYTKYSGYVVPAWKAIDIDWPEDWEHAEKVYKATCKK